MSLDEKEWTFLLKEHETKTASLRLIFKNGYHLDCILLEGTHLLISYDGLFKICLNGQARHFESLDALFHSLSPLYRDCFHQELFEKLKS